MTTKQQKHPMERRLAEIGRRIDGLLNADVDPAALRARIEKEIETWRSWRDEIQVQAQLGAMEARDVLAPKVAKIELGFEHALARVEDLLDAPDLVADDIYTAVCLEMSGLRREIDEAGADFDIAD